MNSSVNRFLGAALVLLVLALAAFLRFYHLNSYSLWSDEFVTLMIVSARSSRELIHACFEIPQPMPPLYFLLTRLPVLWLGPSEISLRLLSAGSSLLIVYLVYKLGRLLFSTEIGLFGALLCAVDTTQIVYAQNARPYALCLMLSCVSYFMFLRWLQTRQRRFQIGYVLSTTLLFYGHYIFFPMVLSQNLFFWWQQRTHHLNSSRNGASLSWKAWLMLQGVVGLLLLPLIPQLAAILRTRFSLNWYKVYPKYSDLFVFFNGKLLFFAAAATLSIAGISLLLKGLWRGQERNRLIVEQLKTDSVHAAKFRWDSLNLLLLWYLVPVLVFFFFARSLGLNLFVERYLVLSTIPTFLVIAAIPFNLPRQWLTRLFLVAYFLHYAYMEPVAYYQEKGEFSQGVPGANEWRETLTELKTSGFDAPLFLFQSPFIESDQLNFADDPQLFQYLSSPLDSFYVTGFKRHIVVMPVHWWINNERHLQFKAKTKQLILSNSDFTLLSTEEFWDNFRPWLELEFSKEYRICEVRSFDSTGALRLKRVRLSQKGYL